MSDPGSGPAASQQLDPDNPWPGLDAFEEAARDYFHGREAEAEELLRRVGEAPLTVLFGKSGLGKTSLLKAGLFPRLRTRHFLPVYTRLDIRAEAPPLVQQMRDSLRASLQQELVDGPAFGPDETLWEYLHHGELELWSRKNQLLTPVLVLDQFEEIFTLGERIPEAVERFRVDLADLAENRIPAALAGRLQQDEAAAARLDLRRMRFKLIVSLREDFLPDLDVWRRVVPTLGRVRVRLLRMRPEQALSAVHGAGSHLMDERVARRVVEFIAAAQTAASPAAMASGEGGDEGRGEIEPALLSLFCRGLNERRKREGKAHFDDGLLDGAKQEIIADYYRSCLDGMPDGVSRFIENELITEKGFRNSYATDDAVPSQITRPQLDRLINRRLLRLEERYGAQRIELTHDLLTQAVREHRDGRRAEDERAALAQRAEQQRRIAEEEARRREEKLEADRGAERQRRLEAEARAGTWFKRLAASLAVMVVFAGAAAGIAVSQGRRAAVSARLAGERLEEATKANELARQRLDRIVESLRLRQAVLSGETIPSGYINTDIRFRATAKEYPYRSRTGLPTYGFAMSPVPESVPGGLGSLAFVTYRMAHHTFPNSLIATGPDRNFTASYDGVGCLSRVVAVIEYADPDKAPAVASFDMCKELGWR
jgi:hypothetical protein